MTKISMKIIIRVIFFCCGVLVLLFAILPLFQPTVPGTADGLAHKFRLLSFKKSLEEGNIRPRWLSDQALGFGSPIFLFNYLLPYYAIAFINAFGFSINLSTEIYEALTLFFSFFGMFFLVRKLWGEKAGLIAASIYTLAPYHLMTIYLYEGWGELTAFMFPPFILYFSIRLVECIRVNCHANSKPKLKNFYLQTFLLVNTNCIVSFILLVLFLSLFLLSHNVSVLIFAPIILMLSAVLAKGKAYIMGVIASAWMMAILLTSFFSLPSVFLNYQTRYPLLIEKEHNMRGSYFKPISLNIKTAFTSIKKGATNYFDFTVGLPIIAGVVVCIGYLFREFFKRFFRKQKIYNNNTEYCKISIITSDIFFITCCTTVFLISLYFSNWYSHPFWQLKPFDFILYPFRFYFPATFAGAILCGWLGMKNRLFLPVMLILAIIAGRPFTFPTIDRFPFQDNYFQNVQTVLYAPGTLKNMATLEFLPKWANLESLEQVEQSFFQTKTLPPLFTLLPKGTLEVIAKKMEYISLTYDTKENATLSVNMFYFPNWEAFVDEKEIVVGKDVDGRMLIAVPKGRHVLTLRFTKTPLENVADGISTGSLILYGLLILYVFKRVLIKKDAISSLS